MVLSVMLQKVSNFLMRYDTRTAHVFIIQVKSVLTCLVSVQIYGIARLRFEFVYLSRLQFGLARDSRHQQLCLLV